MPARTAEARLSTASGHTSANSRCRRRAREDTTATGSQAPIAPKAIATGRVPETTWITTVATRPRLTQRTTNPVTETCPSPARASSCATRPADRLAVRVRRGRKNADQTSISPTPTPSPTSAPISRAPLRIRCTSMPTRS